MEMFLQTELKGKVVLVSLFATWCRPCQLELAEIEKLCGLNIKITITIIISNWS